MNSPAPSVRLVEIHEDHHGQRIDNFLTAQLKGVPKSHIYRILRKGEVRVNKKRIKPTYRLQSGDQVRIPPLRTAEASAPPKLHTVSWLEQTILYEDELLLVLNKPSGIAVHGGSGIHYGVIEALRALRDEATRYELVHRLDRDTSGLLLVAKRRSALRLLQESMRERRMEKHYLALLQGRMRKSRTVLAPLKRQVLRSGERMVRVDPEGKEAESHFRPQLACSSATLAEVEIVTGRTHQIRVHGSHIGHPLAGDERYGERTFNQQMRQRGLNRLFLHAHRLAFPHPRDETTMRLEAPLPDELSRLLEQLQADESCRSF